MSNRSKNRDLISRRHFFHAAGAFAGMAITAPAWSDGILKPSLPGRPVGRELTSAFPEKQQMILQRSRPPLLETPFEVFDRGVFTPNDKFFVRWHWAVIPQEIDVATFRLAIRGHVNNPVSLTLADILAMPRIEYAAVNQCSGNSRSMYTPKVPGAQWEHGAMGNARWTGVPLRLLLERAGVKAGAIAVRFNGLDQPVVDGAPDFMKSLDIDHARDGEVMVAFAMNGEQLPLLNGFPLRLIVPGWYSTYWVKMLSDIEVLDTPDSNYWMATAYRIPDTPHANVQPGETGFRTVPINRMAPRSFITNVRSGDTVRTDTTLPLRGVAFGGDCGVAQVEISTDQGQSWQTTGLGRDEGKYGFRQWNTQVKAPQSGALVLRVRCTNTKGEAQPPQPNWNGGGFMRNVIENVELSIV
jgi:DMSO/TMAO reductase YedYZ molybdopterin-dependent catalytic subunit